MRRRYSKWIKKREEKHDKYWREAGEERENERNDWKEIFKEINEFEYDNVRERRYEEFECANIHDVLY